MVSPRQHVDSLAQSNLPKRSSDGFLKARDVANSVSQITQMDPIHTDNPESILKLIQFLLENFRTQVYNHLVLSAQNTDILRTTVPGQSTTIQRNFVKAIVTHLIKNRTIPVSEVRISGQGFQFLGEDGMKDLFAAHAEIKSGRNRYFPFSTSLGRPFSDFDTSTFLDGASDPNFHNRTRQDVFYDTVQELKVIFEKMLALYARMSPIEFENVDYWGEEDINRWFTNIPSADPVEEFQELNNEAVALYLDFVDQFFDANLLELRTSGSFTPTLYEQGRLFSYLIDSALTQVSWGRMAHFVLKTTEASSDLSLGQKPDYVRYSGAQIVSPLNSVTFDFMTDTFGSQGGALTNSDDLDQIDAEFLNRCDSAFQPKKGVE